MKIDDRFIFFIREVCEENLLKTFKDSVIVFGLKMVCHSLSLQGYSFIYWTMSAMDDDVLEKNSSASITLAT